MNCVGANNYVYFLSLLLSLSVLLTYGTLLGYSLLSQTLRKIVPPEYQAAMKGWTMYFNIWAIVITADAKIGTVTLLMLMTAPLAAAFLAYHTYLVWAGMTTNESSKWADWKCDVEGNRAFKAERSQIPGAPRNLDLAEQPWPVSNDQILGYILEEDSNDIYFMGTNHSEPDSYRDIPNSPWEPTTMGEIHNIYDLGFRDNLRDSVGLSVRRKW
jgi:palmitoyltransferase